MRPDAFEKMTRKEMRVLDSAERNVVDPEMKKTERADERQGDALVDALDLLDHLEDQKVRLEEREQVQERSRFSEAIADFIARFSGSIWFVIVHILWFSFWIVLNAHPELFGVSSSFDPFPFLFLTLTVSLEAIFLSTFILISQNRQATHDRRRDEIDFERDRLDLKVDTLAAKTIREATVKISKIEEQLDRIEKKLEKKK